MEHLSENWIFEGTIDFEYKKYILLAYLEHVRSDFKKSALYPQLGELITHYTNLKQLNENKKMIEGEFPKEVRGVDVENLKVAYRPLIEDDDLMKEIESIVEFAMPVFHRQLDVGKQMYEYIEEKMILEPIGIVPLRKEEGYVFIQNGGATTWVFDYSSTLISSPKENLRGISFTYLDGVEKSISTTLETMKVDLIRRHRKYANPAVYLISSGLQVPLQETTLPIAKRMLMRHLAAA